MFCVKHLSNLPLSCSNLMKMCRGRTVRSGPQLFGQRVEGLGSLAEIGKLEDGLGVR